jgi:hypothetical protein
LWQRVPRARVEIIGDEAAAERFFALSSRS